MATLLDHDRAESSDSSFDGAKAYGELEATERGTQELSDAAGVVLQYLESTRNYLKRQDRVGAGQVNDPTRVAEVNEELKAEFLESGADYDPLVKEVALLCQGAYFDHAIESRLDNLKRLDQSKRDRTSFDKEKSLKLLNAKYLDSLRNTHYKYPQLQREQLENWLARATGDPEYADRRISGLASEVATYEALLDMPEISSIKCATPEEDVLGSDLLVDLNDGRRGLSIDVKSSRPKDADPNTKLFNDVKNSKIRVWIPSNQKDRPIKVDGFRWSNPEVVREYYRDLVFKL